MYESNGFGESTTSQNRQFMVINSNDKQQADDFAGS
jgi:hypothetical protein